MTAGFLERIFKRFSGTLPVLAVDEAGSLAGMFVRDSNGRWIDLPDSKEPSSRDRRCFLALPPGMSAFRTISIKGKDKKQALQAIELEAQTTLFEDLDHGWTTRRIYFDEEQTVVLLAWCSRPYLDSCRALAAELGFQVAGILVPEFCLGQKTPVMLGYQTTDQTGVFYLSENRPPLVQTALASGPDAEALASVVLQDLQALDLEPAVQTIVWAAEAPAENTLAAALQQAGCTMPGIMVQTWADLLPHFEFPGLAARLSAGMGKGQEAFGTFLHAQDDRPLESKEIFRLSGMVLMAVLAVVVFGFSVLMQAEKDLTRLQKEAAAVTRASRKAGQATLMIREVQEKTGLLRTFTQDKPYLLSLIRDIAEATPEESRLETVSIDPSGTISITGFGKNEILVTSMVKKLEESSLINHCQLYGMEKDAEDGQLRFSLEARSRQWQNFFQTGDLP